ncbi:hypothetical protein ACIQXI_04750 [Lysinibacillus sp. NPDC097195]|uniref:hypothetical protein n=1 Tax=Lysinibacillus sp. NPDC097195 TaxID=3364141 RepID=UPI00380E62BC
MDLFSILTFGSLIIYIVLPLLLLFVAISACMYIYVALFKKVLPRSIYHFFLGPVAIIGFLIWAVPLKTGFSEFFKSLLVVFAL